MIKGPCGIVFSIHYKNELHSQLVCNNHACLRENEELGKWNGVHLAEGEVLEPALPDEGDVQQLRGGGGGLGLA